MCPVWLTPDKCRDGFAYPNHDILCSRPVAKGWRNAFTAPPVGSFCNVNVNVNVKWLSLFWLSLSSPPGICILCEKGGHWLTRFSKFVLFSCPFLDLCWQFCLQTIHGVNITPIELSLPCNFLMLRSDAITKWRNTEDWKVTETLIFTPQHGNNGFPQHLVIFCSELVF